MTSNILFVKTGVPGAIKTAHPPLGLLYLASSLRKNVSNSLEFKIIDLRLPNKSEADLLQLAEKATIIGFSIMNAESNYAIDLIEIIKKANPSKIIAVGGPWTYRNSLNILKSNCYIDWVFEGEAERTFAEAISRYISSRDLGIDIRGFYYRDQSSHKTIGNNKRDLIENLDEIPLPAWDLIDFQDYTLVNSMNFINKGELYAPIITSRGCPYRCAYCHGIMGTKVRFRSVPNLMEEITLLLNSYKIEELQIVDDIFNINRSRVRVFFNTLKTTFPKNKIYFSFPNAVRGDILTKEIIDLFRENGVYSLTVAFETASPRLQKLICKNLDIDKTNEMISYAHKKGIITKGYFMLGFPTENVREIFKTINFAFWSKLDFASFFSVVPQRGTPLSDLAKKHAPSVSYNSEDLSYYANKSWYEQAYGFKIDWVIRVTVLLFYFLSPRRLFRIIRIIGIKDFFKKSAEGILSVFLRWK